MRRSINDLPSSLINRPRCHWRREDRDGGSQLCAGVRAHMHMSVMDRGSADAERGKMEWGHQRDLLPHGSMLQPTTAADRWGGG